MGPNIPGVPVPDGKSRKRKKKGGFLRRCRDLTVSLLVCAALVLAVFAVPLLLGFDPMDAANFVDAPGLAKIDAFMDGWRHKRGISEMTFSHNGRTITFTDDNGTLTGIDAEGYGYADGGDFESDLDEARRILKEWGLD